MISPWLLADREDVFLADDEVLFAVDVDLGARVLVEEDAVALLHVERLQLAVFGHLPLADRDHLALLGLLLGGVGDDDAALGLGFLVDALHEDSVLERTDLHDFGSSGPRPRGARRLAVLGPARMRAPDPHDPAIDRTVVFGSRGIGLPARRNVCTLP